ARPARRGTPMAGLRGRAKARAARDQSQWRGDIGTRTVACRESVSSPGRDASISASSLAWMTEARVVGGVVASRVRIWLMCIADPVSFAGKVDGASLRARSRAVARVGDARCVAFVTL